MELGESYDVDVVNMLVKIDQIDFWAVPSRHHFHYFDTDNRSVWHLLIIFECGCLPPPLPSADRSH